MAVYSKIILSGSVDGQPIAVTGIAPSTANTVHTAPAVTTSIDEIYLYAYNTATTNRELVLRWGTTATGQGIRHIQKTIPFQDGLYLVIPGLPLSNSNTVRAYATAADKLALVGYVNRVS